MLTSQAISDQIAAKLTTLEFQQRALFDRFNMQVLTTTDPASNTLAYHQAIRDSAWNGDIRPTFRPDAVINLDTPGWRENIDLLAEVSGVDVYDYGSYIEVLEARRAFFKAMGATATDHAAVSAYTERLSDSKANAIFQRSLSGHTIGSSVVVL